MLNFDQIFSITSFLRSSPSYAFPVVAIRVQSLASVPTYLPVNLVPHFLIVDANFSLTKNSRTFPSASKFLISQSPVRDPSRGIDFLGADNDDDDGEDERRLYGFANKSRTSFRSLSSFSADDTDKRVTIYSTDEEDRDLGAVCAYAG